MTNQPEPTPARIEMLRGAQAQELIDNPLIAEALSAWETEITKAWKTSPLRDAEGRESLRRLLEASTRFRRYLTQTIETGQLARVQQERETAMQKAARVVRGAFR